MVLQLDVSLHGQPATRRLPTHDNPKENEHEQISSSQFGFEPTNPVFEVSKAVHILHSVDTAIDGVQVRPHILSTVSYEAKFSEANEHQDTHLAGAWVDHGTGVGAR